MTYFRIGALIALTAGLLGACSSKVSHGDSETHWIVCSTEADCNPGQSCEEKHCVGAPDGGARIHITNPTGTCVAPNNGARQGYHSPDPGDVWLPDCNNTLKREYWRVFAKSETNAYVIPRPDGARELTESVCQIDTHPLRALVQKYALCERAGTPDAGARVNDMLPADALVITHYLHTQLLFSPGSRIGIAPADPTAQPLPFPIPSDVLDACALYSDRLSPELSAACAAVRQSLVTDIAIDLAPVGPELTSLLNELYGVGADCPAGENKFRVCLGCGLAGGCGPSEVLCTHTCADNPECAQATAGAICTGVCGPVSLFCL